MWWLSFSLDSAQPCLMYCVTTQFSHPLSLLKLLKNPNLYRKLWHQVRGVSCPFYILTVQALWGLEQWRLGSQLYTYGPKCVWSKRYAKYVCGRRKEEKKDGKEGGRKPLYFSTSLKQVQECDNSNKMCLNSVVGFSSKTVIYKTLQNMLILNFRS